MNYNTQLVVRGREVIIQSLNSAWVYESVRASAAGVPLAVDVDRKIVGRGRDSVEISEEALEKSKRIGGVSGKG